jgi:hypothetical protein
MIPPGEGMLVEVPGNDSVAPVQTVPTLADDVAELLKKSVANLLLQLPNLSADAIDMMVALENGAAAPRKTLLSAIAQEQMARANAAMLAEKERTRLAELDVAQTSLLAAQAALDASGDTDEHPALEAAVATAKATVDALSVPAQD